VRLFLRAASDWRVLLALVPLIIAMVVVDLASSWLPPPPGTGDTRVMSRPYPGDMPESPGGDAAVLWAVGDVGDCGSSGDEETAKLPGASPGTVAILGDVAYESGTEQQFADCYGASWGGLRDRTRPVPGNHDYRTAGAAPYFAYFGDLAGDPTRGYYSYDLGSWHIVALNSNCDAVGGCGEGSPQLDWLADDLARSNARCTLAYWHHPLVSSGVHGNDPRMRTAFDQLDRVGADVVLAGHDHDYERFAPQDSSGSATANGVRQFVVGTGGKSLRGFTRVRANSEVRLSRDFGVLRLTLEASGYRWDFITVGGEVIDSGSSTCR